MRVYADYNASAPLRPEARAAITLAMEAVGNPSSPHRDGARLRRMIEDARASVARVVGAEPGNLVFTSGATEANALALSQIRGGERLVTSRIEHASLLAPAERLRRGGTDVSFVRVSDQGEIDLDELRRALAGSPAMVALGVANAEVGSVLPRAAYDLVREHGARLHLDAAQALGRGAYPRLAGPASISISGHKIGAPSGIGVLVAHDGAVIEPLVLGGAQERDRRAGTENVLGIVALGAVAERLLACEADEVRRIGALRDRLWERLRTATPTLRRNGPPASRCMPNVLNVTAPGISGEALLVRLDLAGISVSLGSACQAGAPEPSHVLLAMGRSETDARAGVRISLGHASTEADVDRIASVFSDAVRESRRGAAA